MSRTVVVQVRFESLYISLASCAMSVERFLENVNRNGNFVVSSLQLKAAISAC